MNLLENRISSRQNKPADNLVKEVAKQEKVARVFGRNLTNLQQPQLSRNAKLPGNIVSNNNSLSTNFANNKTEKSFERARSRSNSHYSPKDILKQYSQQLQFSLLSKDIKQNKVLSTEVNARMWAILIDWLIDVHSSFDLSEQTLAQCFALLNQVASRMQITKFELQLVGITCLWISSKYQEIYPPRMKNYVEITADTYTQAQMNDMEGRILAAVEFKLVKCTTFQMLELVLEGQTNFKLRSLCKYLLQLTELNMQFENIRLSELILAVIEVSQKVLKEKALYSRFRTKLQKQRQIDDKVIFKSIYLLMESTAQKYPSLKAIKKKYADEKHHQVSRIVVDCRENHI